jgi:hypothetical protein
MIPLTVDKVLMIGDDEKLCEIAKTREYQDIIRITAMENIKDDMMLLDLILNADDEIYSHAIYGISNPDRLEDIVFSDVCPEFKYNALTRMDDDRLRGICKKTDDETVKMLAAEAYDDGRLRRRRLSGHS